MINAIIYTLLNGFAFNVVADMGSSYITRSGVMRLEKTEKICSFKVHG